MLFFLFLSVFHLLLVISDGQYLVYVNTTRGSVVGFHYNLGNDTSYLYYGEADVFLGIPYVEPPQRFQRPVQLTKFPGTAPYNATYFLPICPQSGLPDVPQSENCLFLNIYTPKFDSKTPYPVMIWIHGGALVAGSAWEYPLNGGIRNLVSRGVVVVVIQYRLGLLGFFSTNTDDFPANLGLLDQVEAIKFVKEEIPNFGGDPNQITLFGESAGGLSISALTYSPLSKDLFQRGILESTAIFERLEGELGIQTDFYNILFNQFCNYTYAQWQTKDYKPLKDCLLQVNISQWVEDDDYSYIFLVDGYFLPDNPNVSWKNRSSNISILIGSNRDESMFDYMEGLLSGEVNLDDFNREAINEVIEAIVNDPHIPAESKDFTRNMIENIYVPYGIDDNDHLGWLKIWNNINSGVHTGSIAKDVDYWLWSSNPNVYVYEFVYPSKLGFMKYLNISGFQPVPHAVELYYIWMGWQDAYVWRDAINQSLVDQTDFDLLDFFGETWTNFAKSGKPHSTRKPNFNWEPITQENYNYLEIGAHQVMKNEYRPKDHIFFNKIIPNLGSKQLETSTLEPTSEPTTETSSQPTTTSGKSSGIIYKSSLFCTLGAIFTLLREYLI